MIAQILEIAAALVTLISTLVAISTRPTRQMAAEILQEETLDPTNTTPHPTLQLHTISLTIAVGSMCALLLVILSQWIGGTRDIPTILGEIHSDNPETRAAAVAELRELHDGLYKAMKPMHVVLKDEDPATRAEAVKFFAAMGAPASETVAAMRIGLADASPEVRRSAAEQLQRVMHLEGSTDLACSALGDADEETRNHAHAVLLTTSPNAIKTAMPIITQVIQSGQPINRVAAATVLISAHLADSSIADALIDICVAAGNDTSLQEASLKALGMMQKDALPALPRLVFRATATDNIGIHRYVSQTIGILHPDSAVLQKLIQEKIKTGSPDVRLRALYLLAGELFSSHSSPPPSGDVVTSSDIIAATDKAPILLEALQDTAEVNRLTSACQLLSIGMHTKEAITTLLSLSSSREEEIRNHVALGMECYAQYFTVADMPFLQQLFTCKHMAIRNAAVVAAIHINPAEPELLPVLEKMLQEQAENQLIVLEALNKVGQVAPAIQRSVQSIAERNLDDETLSRIDCMVIYRATELLKKLHP